MPKINGQEKTWKEAAQMMLMVLGVIMQAVFPRR